MISVSTMFENNDILKRRYGKYPEIKLPKSISRKSLNTIKQYIDTYYKTARIAADSKQVEKV